MRRYLAPISNPRIFRPSPEQGGQKNLIELPDFGIPSWTIAPVYVDLALNLIREDLCVTREFFNDYAVWSLDELLIKFVNVEPFATPLIYTLRFQFAAITYQTYVSGCLLRRNRRMTESRGLIQGARLWDNFPDDTILELCVDRHYRRKLRVGVALEKQATQH